MISAALIYELAVRMFFKGSMGFTGSICDETLEEGGFGNDLVKSSVIILEGFFFDSTTNGAIG